MRVLVVLIASALSAYLDSEKKNLAAIAKQAEKAELERVAVVHGGDAA